MSNIIRINARISSEINDWLDAESAKTGITKSALVHLALEQYIQQKEVIHSMRDIGMLNEVVNRIEKLEMILDAKK